MRPYVQFALILLTWECFDKDYRGSQGIAQIAELTLFFFLSILSFLLELTLFINDGLYL